MAAEAPVRHAVRHRLIAPGPSMLAEACAEVDALPGLSEAARTDLALLVCEVVGNAVRHSRLAPGDRVELSLEAVPGEVRMEVRDPGPGFDPVTPVRAPDAATGGRGLWLVEQVADRWGVEHTGDGFVVWLQLWTGAWRTRHLLRPVAPPDAADLSESEIKGLIADLTSRERAVSAERARLHARLSELTRELARRRGTVPRPRRRPPYPCAAEDHQIAR